MSKTMWVGVVAAVILGASQASAAVNVRERLQGERIGSGYRSGDLTGREAARLSAQQAWIRAEERRYRHNDGHLGPRERADLQRDLLRASRNVYVQRHDGQRR